jgi:hypothetical protein
VLGITSVSRASFGRRPYGRRAASTHDSLATGRVVSGRAEPPRPVATAIKAMARVGIPEDWARLISARREGTGPPGPRARSYPFRPVIDQEVCGGIQGSPARASRRASRGWIPWLRAVPR